MTLAELARLESQGPGLRDVFGYIDNVGNGAYAVTPNGMSGGEQGWGTTGLGLEVANTQANNGADGNQAQAPVTFKPDDVFRGAVTMRPQSPNGEGSGGWFFDVDGSKLPQTRFGDITRAAPVHQGHTDLYNPNVQYNDENYGQITDARNVNTQSWSDMVMPALLSAAMGGMGMLGAPALGTQLVGLARTLGNGGDITGGILGMLGQQFGLPSWATTLGRLAYDQFGDRKP